MNTRLCAAPWPCVMGLELPHTFTRGGGVRSRAQELRWDSDILHIHETNCPAHLPAARHTCLQSELADMRAVEVPALESRHKEALAKLSSEVARLKHALKEAEAVAAAAQAEAAAATTQSTLQSQLQEAEKGRERCAQGA